MPSNLYSLPFHSPNAAFVYLPIIFSIASRYHLNPISRNLGWTNMEPTFFIQPLIQDVLKEKDLMDFGSPPAPGEHNQTLLPIRFNRYLDLLTF